MYKNRNGWEVSAMLVYLFVGIAGAVGALLRYGISLAFPFNGDAFPLATAGANLLGSFFITLLMAYFSGKKRLSEKLETALFVGFFGSFTTFSTFSVETIQLFQHQAYLLAVVYVALSVFGGFFLAFIGYEIGKRLSGQGGGA